MQNIIIKNQWLHFFSAIVVALLVLVPRLDGVEYYAGKYLWAEDGSVFLNQSHELGIQAIYTSYAGYLHIYPRVIAQISLLFDLSWRPICFIIGWVTAYLILVHSIVRLFVLERLRLCMLYPVIALMSLQPNDGEVFFNITNSQWFLGAALCLYALVNSRGGAISWINGTLLMGLSLTGPFSIFIAPVLFIKTFIENKFNENKFVFGIVLVGAFIQATLFLSSERLNAGALNRNLLEWVVAFFKIACFNVGGKYLLLAALVIWVLIAYMFYKSFARKIVESNVKLALYFLISAFIFILAGLVSHKHDPGAIVSIGSGKRYTWMPFVFILVSVALLLNRDRNRNIEILFLCLFGIIWNANFHKVPASNLQFESFAKMASVETVIIPINPMWPAYPGWHVKAGPADGGSGGGLDLPFKNISTSQIESYYKNNSLNIRSTGVDPVVVINDYKLCPNRHYVGVNIRILRDKGGWMQLFWSRDGKFEEANSLRRYYPDGLVKAQFAFPSSEMGMILRFDPMETEGLARLEGIDYYCFD